MDAWEFWVKKGVVTGGAFDSEQGCRPYPFPPCSGVNASQYSDCKGSHMFDTPKCEQTCESGYFTPYAKDKFYGLFPSPGPEFVFWPYRGYRPRARKAEKRRKRHSPRPLSCEGRHARNATIAGNSSYGVRADVESIQKEILFRGPVEVAFDVYEDFYEYSSGVYQVTHESYRPSIYGDQVFFLQYTKGQLVGGHAVKMIGWGEEDGLPFWLVANSWDTEWGIQGFFKILRGANECGIESGVVGGEPLLPEEDVKTDRPL